MSEGVGVGSDVADDEVEVADQDGPGYYSRGQQGRFPYDTVTHSRIHLESERSEWLEGLASVEAKGLNKEPPKV